MWVSPIFERFSEFLDKLSYYYLADELEGTSTGDDDCTAPRRLA